MFRHWPLIERDLAEVYGIDVEDDDLLTRRSWRWLCNRITGLIDRPPTITPTGHVLASTRLGLALNPPREE